MRIILLLAAAYHLAFAFWANFWPNHGFDLLGISRPNHPMLWRSIGLISGVLGLALLIASSNPIRHWLIVLLGFGKALAASLLISVAVFEGDLPREVLSFLMLDDLIWLLPYSALLWVAIRSLTGIPASRDTPYPIKQAAQLYELSTGETLAKASEEKALVLVFLRHFGCTFTRQILRGLEDLESQAKQHNATLVLVHMLKSGQEIEYLGHHSEIPRIADPRCELYRSFGLGKGGFLELFGPQVLWRGILAIFKGCGIGHLAGDGLQMPGVFVFQNNVIIASQPARTAAHLPNLGALFSHKASS
jgi:hypothetical protein